MLNKLNRTQTTKYNQDNSEKMGISGEIETVKKNQIEILVLRNTIT